VQVTAGNKLLLAVPSSAVMEHIPNVICLHKAPIVF
jgi:hypothetical protein